MTGPERLIAAMPFARFLGVELHPEDAGLVLRLPYRDGLIGNPLIPALHGGVIGAFMEITAMAHLAQFVASTHLPRPIDVNVQYLRSGKALDCHARARLNRQGRTIANVEVHCWQSDEQAPIASLQAHFLLSEQIS